MMARGSRWWRAVTAAMATAVLAGGSATVAWAAPAPPDPAAPMPMDRPVRLAPPTSTAPDPPVRDVPERRSLLPMALPSEQRQSQGYDTATTTAMLRAPPPDSRAPGRRDSQQPHDRPPQMPPGVDVLHHVPHYVGHDNAHSRPDCAAPIATPHRT